MCKYDDLTTAQLYAHTRQSECVRLGEIKRPHYWFTSANVNEVIKHHIDKWTSCLYDHYAVCKTRNHISFYFSWVDYVNDAPRQDVCVFVLVPNCQSPDVYGTAQLKVDVLTEDGTTVLASQSIPHKFISEYLVNDSITAYANTSNDGSQVAGICTVRYRVGPTKELSGPLLPEYRQLIKSISITLIPRKMYTDLIEMGTKFFYHHLSKEETIATLQAYTDSQDQYAK